LVVLSGDLGAGKTTLVQGIGAGLGVRGPITSPTFVIARVHPSLAGGPALVHADAYRLSSPAEGDDLDLDASLETSVTGVEWGGGRTPLVGGMGAGLGVRGPITSPTFVIARVHPSLAGGPALVHADAYRLSSPAEVDDLDLDASLETSVTVVEWGGGLAEGLAADRPDRSIAPAPPPAPRPAGLAG